MSFEKVWLDSNGIEHRDTYPDYEFTKVVGGSEETTNSSTPYNQRDFQAGSDKFSVVGYKP